MKRIVLFILIMTALNANAAILVMSPNGTYTTKQTLSQAAIAPDAAGKVVVVTSALSAVQSNISSATLHGWPSDRTLKIEKGGSIGNTTLFRINGPLVAGQHQIFNGSGTVSFGTDSNIVKNGVWGATTGVGTTTIGAADIVINGNSTIMNHHAVEDWKVMTPSATGYGYASFDAKPTITGSGDNNHLVGFQSRPIYNSSGNLTNYFHSIDSAPVHTGSGNIPFLSHLNITDVGGAGPVGDQYGVYIGAMTRGSGVNYGVYSIPPIVAGAYLTNALNTGYNYGFDLPNKAMTFGYGTGGTANYGSYSFYDGKTGVLLTMDHTGSLFNVPIGPGQYTYANLPAAINGYTAYCTNCRKTGEGAGAGTGLPTYYSNGAWRRYYDDAVVTQ